MLLVLVLPTMTNNLKIATWNLESKQSLTIEKEEAFRNEIYGRKADVWVLTETWLNFSLVGYRLVAQTCQADDLIHAKRPFARWVAIWMRENWSGRQLEVFSDPERMACIRIEEGGYPVVVVGTVLPWGTDKRHPPIEGVAQEDIASAEFCLMLQAQSEEWRQLWANQGKTAFCVTGDFNQRSLFFPHPKRNKRHICINHAFKGLDCLTNNTKVVYPKEKKEGPTIDHICVGGGLRLKPATRPETWEVPVIDETAITDHAGVAADLII